MAEAKRCGWCGEDPLYREYHDTEWGRLVVDDHKMFDARKRPGRPELDHHPAQAGELPAGIRRFRRGARGGVYGCGR